MDVDFVAEKIPGVRLTYAEVVASQKLQLDCIRNIETSQESQTETIENELLNNERIKVLSGEMMKKRNAYTESCKVIIPRPYTPTIKITGLNDTTSDVLDLLKTIDEQNSRLMLILKLSVNIKFT